MAGFMPGASPPEVKTAIFLSIGREFTLKESFLKFLLNSGVKREKLMNYTFLKLFSKFHFLS